MHKPLLAALVRARACVCCDVLCVCVNVLWVCVHAHKYDDDALVEAHEADEGEEEDGADANQQAHDEDGRVLRALALVRDAEDAAADGQDDGHALAQEHLEDEQQEVSVCV